MKKLSFCFLILLFLSPLASAQSSLEAKIRPYIQNGSVLAVDEKGQVLVSINADRTYVPASILKVPTSLAALKILGKDFRFKTEFYIDKEDNLYFKGYGDPFLVSEEFPRIVEQLKAKGLKQINNIILDSSFFEPNIHIDGLTASLNPYDAYNGALLANFNTVSVVKLKGGKVQSAEPQTPLTEITAQLAARAPIGRSRINVATNETLAPLYPGYLLKQFLINQGVSTRGQVTEGKVPGSAKLLLDYKSSKSLEDVLSYGLEFSQNLVMNQTFLVMGAEKLGAPATIEKAQKIYRDYLKNEVALQNIQVVEGSGISRKNLVTAFEMDEILVHFFPHYQLLPFKKGGWVKTGTLTGVSTLVGYFQSMNHGWVRFVILLNQPTNQRDKIFSILKTNL